MIAINQRVAARADKQSLRRERQLRCAFERFFDVEPEDGLTVNDAIGRESERGDVRRGELNVLGIERHDGVQVARIPGGVIAAGEIDVAHAALAGFREGWTMAPS